MIIYHMLDRKNQCSTSLVKHKLKLWENNIGDLKRESYNMPRFLKEQL